MEEQDFRKDLKMFNLLAQLNKKYFSTMQI